MSYESNFWIFINSDNQIFKNAIFYFCRTLIKRQCVCLPINNSSQPDYEYMKQYKKNIMIKKHREYLDCCDNFMLKKNQKSPFQMKKEALIPDKIR